MPWWYSWDIELAELDFSGIEIECWDFECVKIGGSGGVANPISEFSSSSSSLSLALDAQHAPS